MPLLRCAYRLFCQIVLQNFFGLGAKNIFPGEFNRSLQHCSPELLARAKKGDRINLSQCVN